MQDSQRHSLDGYARNVIRYKARKLIGKYGFACDDYEDLTQEMTLDLLTRLPRFNAARTSMNTFVSRLVDNKVSTIIRHRKQEKRDFRREAWSLNETIENEEGQNIERGHAVSQDQYDLRMGNRTQTEAERLDMRVDIALVVATLPPNLQQLAEDLMTFSIAEAASKWGIPRSTLYEKGIAPLRKVFEDRGLREYISGVRRFAEPEGM